LVEEEDQQWPRRVTVQSPESAFWELQAYPADTNPQRLADQALDAFRDEYEDVDYEIVSADLNDTQVVGYDLEFFCLDFLVTCQVRSFALGGQTLLLLCQAEGREFRQCQDEFESMSRSLFPAANGELS
jgi:hypothetical protein